MNLRQLSRLSYANGFTLWHYGALEREDQRISKDPWFFAEASNMLQPGDMIMVSSNWYGAMLLVSKSQISGQLSTTVLKETI